FELRDSEGTGQVRHAVVEAEPVVVEPAHVGRAALVALAVDALLVGVGRAHDDPALPGGELLVRVEGEDGEVAARTHRGSVLVGRAERLAGVLDDPQATPAGEP